MTNPEQRTYSAAVIGTGFAREHLQLLAQCSRVTVDWLAYKDGRAAAAALATEFGVRRVTNDASELLRSAIDFVVVVSPLDTHFPLCAAFLESGKMVVCDKPLAMTAEQARRLVGLSEVAALPTMVFFQWRFNHAVRQLKTLCDTGRLGRIRHVSAEFYHDFMADPSAPWTWRNDVTRAGLGAFGDMGVHLVDLIRWVTRDEVMVKHAVGLTFHERRRSGDVDQLCTTEDLVQVVFELRESGAAGTIVACRAFPGRRAIRLSIMGEAGGVELALDPSTATGRLESFGGATLPASVDQPENPYAHWLAHLDGKAEVPTFTDGLRAQQVMDDVAAHLRQPTPAAGNR